MQEDRETVTKRPTSVRELLKMFANENKPAIRPYDPVNPQQFANDLSKLATWQRAQALKFFQAVLGIGDRMYIGRKVHEKLLDFVGENFKIPKQDTISDYLAGGDNKDGKITPWPKDVLYLVCMALGICKEDSTNAKKLFNLFGQPYARFADPVDIVYAWATEKNYTFAQLENLLKRTAPYHVDLKAEYDFKIAELKKAKNDDYVIELSNNDPLDETFTGSIEEAFRLVWANGCEDELVETFEDYADDFHYCSVTRAAIIEKLYVDNLNDDKYLPLMEGYAQVTRDDIIHLGCDVGLSVSQIDDYLISAGFAPIDAECELGGIVLSEMGMPESERKKLFLWTLE